MALVVGLDCGGSTSRALATDENGTAVWRSQSGPANLATTERASLEANVKSLLDECPQVEVVCGCFAGLLTDGDRQTAIDVLRSIVPRAAIRAEPDFVAALWSAPNEVEVVVIAGTGSLVCSRDGGSWHKSGGGGYLLGDPGSGFRYGLAALKRFLQGPESCSAFLRDEVQRMFGSTDPATVIARTYRPTPSVKRIAGLMSAFLDDLTHSQPYAEEALRRELQELAEQVICHTHKHFPGQDPVTIGLTGGVWKTARHLSKRFADALEDRDPRRSWKIVNIARPPVEGAAKLARQMLTK